MKKYLFNFTLCFFLPGFILAQLQLSGEIRPRTEYRHGFKTLAQKDQQAAFFTDQRTRLNVGFQSENIQYYLSLQDVRVWGDQPQLVSNNGAATGVHQGWAKIKLSKQWGLKLGRQEIAYDDQRILGNVGWAQQARSHDAAILMFQDSTFKGHLGLAFNQSNARLFSTRYTIANNYKTIQYLWLHKDWKNINGSFLFLNNGQQVNFANGDFETNFSQTIGGRLSYQHHHFTTNLALYYQGGTNPDTLDTKINAFYLGVDISYIMKKNIILTLGLEMLSGNDSFDANGENNAFNPLYGTNHKFNGLMDYFYVGNHLGNVGLNDLFLKGLYKQKRWSMSLALHYFLSDGSLVDPQNNRLSLDNFLGIEADYTLVWKINKEANLKLGYSQIFATRTMEALKGGDRKEINNWVWAMISVNPSFTFKK